MGTWGVALYDNDTAADVRGEWVDKVRLGASGKAATDELIKAFGEDDPIFWVALADTQWTWGRLEPRVLKRARDAIAKGGDLELWTEAKDRAARQRMFEKVAARLAKPPPKPKPVGASPDLAAWKRGQLWSYRTLDGKQAVFRVTAVDPGYGLVPSPMLELLDVVFEDEPPAPEALAKAPVRPTRAEYKLRDAVLETVLPEHRASPMFEASVKRRGERPGHRLKKLRAAGEPRPAEPTTKAVGVPWDTLDEFLADVFDIGGPRVGAIHAWPLKAGGGLAYTIVEIAEFPRTLLAPQWQLGVLDCSGPKVDPRKLASAPVRARMMVDGVPPAGLLHEVGFRRLQSVDAISGMIYSWDDVSKRLAAPEELVDSNAAMKAFLAAVAAKAKAKAAKKKR